MSLTCLVCHYCGSSSTCLRSYFIASSDNDGRCSAIMNCLAKNVPIHSEDNTRTSKVVPISSTPRSGSTGFPRLVRSRAVTRDPVRDWNFDEATVHG